MFRISKLSLYNFKGFKETEILFDNPRTILGGPNGYGKTSIFDALELLFTGSIKRMLDYKAGHDSRTSLKENFKPLVFDTSIDEIVIEATLLFNDGNRVRIRRRAEQGTMRNPVDFSAFSKLQCYNQINNSFEDVDTNERLSSFFSLLSEQYNFLNYLTQEEANCFLKCKESERKQKINSLFNTTEYDDSIECLSLIRKEVLGKVNVLKEEATKVEQDIASLKSMTPQGQDESDDTGYTKLFNKAIEWDNVKPHLSFEDFNNLLGENGLLDHLHYYCQNADTYVLYETYNKLGTIQDAENMRQLSLWLKWRKHEELLDRFNKYENGIRNEWEELTLSSILTFSLDVPSYLPEGLINQEDVKKLNEQLHSIKSFAKSTGNLQRAYSDMAGARNIAEKTLLDVEDELKFTKCPLCGTEHNSEYELVKKITDFGIQFNDYLKQVTQGVVTSVERLKNQIEIIIIRPIDEYFRSSGISRELFDSYSALDMDSLGEQYSFLVRRLSISDNLADDELLLETHIEKWKTANPLILPSDFDGMLLRKVYTSYGRYLLPESVNGTAIEKKRHYLTNLWNEMSSKYLAEKKTLVSSLKAQCIKLNGQATIIKQTMDKIKSQKSSYLSKMVNQIETLFYIYTGRIMQDNYYGRGCYLKYNSTNSNVLFTSGSPENEVDALFKMSSGQLVSISVAFMLTVNKLYANNHIIAIDDPVQTIDDLNLWGLMETLRHDFTNSMILLSTHERDFGLLLTDKFNKMGLHTEYVDMSQHH